jgi:hypothetical protein
MLAAVLIALSSILILAGLGALAVWRLMRRMVTAITAMRDDISNIPDPDELDPPTPQAVIEADRSGFFAPPPGSTQ